MVMCMVDTVNSWVFLVRWLVDFFIVSIADYKMK